MTAPEQPPTRGVWRAVLDLSAGWAAALLTLAGIVLLAVGVATHSLTAATIAVTVVGLIFVGWLLWLSFIVAGHGERIDDAADLADRALGATGEVYDADAGTRGRHAARSAPDGPRTALSASLRADTPVPRLPTTAERDGISSQTNGGVA